MLNFDFVAGKNVQSWHIMLHLPPLPRGKFIRGASLTTNRKNQCLCRVSITGTNERLTCHLLLLLLFTLPRSKDSPHPPWVNRIATAAQDSGSSGAPNTFSTHAHKRPLTCLFVRACVYLLITLLTEAPVNGIYL